MLTILIQISFFPSISDGSLKYSAIYYRFNCDTSGTELISHTPSNFREKRTKKKRGRTAVKEKSEQK